MEDLWWLCLKMLNFDKNNFVSQGQGYFMIQRKCSPIISLFRNLRSYVKNIIFWLPNTTDVKQMQTKQEQLALLQFLGYLARKLILCTLSNTILPS